MDNSNAPVAFITGGTSGIGLETAKRFAGQGYRIVICGRDQSRLLDAERAIESCGAASCTSYVVDLADVSAAKEFVDLAIREMGRVDVLVNNAAVAPLQPMDAMSSDAFESVVNVNVRATFYVTQAIWKAMQSQQAGVIVNVSSLAAIDPFPGFGVYGASKAWADLMTTALAAEGKPHGIRVYSVRPGAVDTPLLRGLFPDFPTGDTVRPADVAGVIWSLCQSDFQFSSGEAIAVKK